MNAPLPNSYRVSHEALFAGEYPGDLDSREARQNVAALLDAGITVFIDLTAPDDRMTPYEDVLHEEARQRGVDARRVAMPVPDMGIATPLAMHRILDEIDAHLANGRATYVHCWGGVGRTGLVVGCHLVRRGSDGAAALQRVADLFATMSPHKVASHGGMSPQTSAQHDMVRDWERHERATDGGRGA